MTKLTYAQQIKADRKAAAMARRQDDYRQDAGYVKAYKNYKSVNTKKQTITLASIARRLNGRLNSLKTLDLGFNEAHLFILEAVVANYTNQELKDMLLGQNAFIGSLDQTVKKDLGLDEIWIEGLKDDDQTSKNPKALFMFVQDEDVNFAKEYINKLVVDRKNA